MILLVVLYILLSVSYVLSKAVLDYIAPIFFVGIRMVTAGLLLLGFQYFLDRKNWYFNKRDIPLLFAISLFHVYLMFTLEFWGLQYLPSFKCSFLFTLTPFIMAFFEWIVFSEIMSTKKWIGLIIGFLGVIPILLQDASPDEIKSSFFVFSLPELSVLGAVISGAFAWILIKKLVKRNNYTPSSINGIAMLWGGILALITSLLIENRPLLKFPPESTKINLLGIYVQDYLFGQNGSILLIIAFYMFSLILLANIGFYNLYIHLLKKYSVTFISFAGFMAPLFTGILGWMFLGEQLSVIFFVSVFIVSFGLYIFYQDELQAK